MRPINKIIIQLVHVQNSDALINKHLNENNMPEVGFHYMIEPDGTTKIGRTIRTIGNHFKGENSSSIGIALIGEDINEKHRLTLASLLEEIELKVSGIKDVLYAKNGVLEYYIGIWNKHIKED